MLAKEGKKGEEEQKQIGGKDEVAEKDSGKSSAVKTTEDTVKSRKSAK